MVISMVRKASPRRRLGVGGYRGSKASPSPSQDVYGVRLKSKASPERPKASFVASWRMRWSPLGTDGKSRGTEVNRVAGGKSMQKEREG